MPTKTEELNQTEKEIYDIVRRYLGNNPKADIEVYYQAFKEIQALGQTTFEVIAKNQRDERLITVLSNVGESGLDYLEFAAKIEKLGKGFDEANGVYALGALLKLGQAGLERLLRVFEASTSRFKRAAVVSSLASVEGSLPYLKKYIDDKDQEVRNSIFIGILNYISQQEMLASFELKQPLSPAIEPFIEIVRHTTTEADAEVRRLGVRVLSKIQCLSIEELTTVADDPDDDVRGQVLTSIAEAGIDKSNAFLYVRFFEDSDGDISKSSIEHLNSYRSLDIDAEAVARAIIDELVIRKSGRPKEFFSPQTTVSGIEPLFTINPRVYEFIHNNLCELAFGDDKDISERALKVGAKLSPSHFPSLIRIKGEANPEKATKLLYILGESVNLPSLTTSLSDYTKNLKELEDESISRWKEITKQSKINYWVRMTATTIFFIVSLGIILFGVYLIVVSNDIYTKGAGVLISLVTTIGGMWTNFWKASIDDIKASHIQQAGLEGGYISFMTLNGQVRLVFSRSYEKGEITPEQLQTFHGLTANALELLMTALSKAHDMKN